MTWTLTPYEFEARVSASVGGVPALIFGGRPMVEEDERDRIPEALPEVERLPEPGNDADDADDDVASDAKPQAGQELG